VIYNISGVEACERLTTMGIGLNLVIYLTGTMHLRNAFSANIVTNFAGTGYMLCLLGGFVADNFIGRFVFTQYSKKYRRCILYLCYSTH